MGLQPINKAGSWSVGGVRIPDWGVTERLSGSRTAQGGSNLLSPILQKFVQQGIQQKTNGMVNIGSGGTTPQLLGMATQQNTGTPVYNPNMQSVPGFPSPTINTGGANPTTGGTTGGGNYYATTGFEQNVPSGDMSPEMQAAINDYYNPAFERLNLLEQGYQQQLPLAQQRVTNSYNEALQPINERLATGEASIANQKTQTEQGRQSAISQARQLYNELLQQGLNKFGGASSTGGAYASIIGNQIAKNMGGIEQTSANTGAQLDTELRNLNDFVAKQKSDLEAKKITAMDQVNADYDQKIREINMQRNTLESDKAAQRIDALKEARQRAYAVEDANAAYQRQIDMFNQQTQATLSQQYSVNGGISSKALDMFNKLVYTGIPAVTAARLTGIDTSLLQGVTISPTNAWKKDEITGQWVNTQTGEVASAPDGLDTLTLPGQQG